MQYIYVVAGLMAVLGVVSVALVFTSMQLQSLVSEAESFKAKAIEANNRLKQENEQLRYQMQGLIARMQSGSSPAQGSVVENLSEIPMVTIAKGRLSGVMEQKNLVIRSNDELVQVWEEIYSGRPDKPPVPQVDFASATVLVAFNGERSNSCHDIMIKNVRMLSDEHFGSEKVATVNRIEPTADAVCEQVPTQAYHLVAIPFSLGEISFDVWVENTN